MYHYAGNNPIRYTDPDGRIQYPILSLHTMQELGDKATLNGSDEFMKDYGCAVATVSNMLNLSLNFVNEKYVTKGNLNWEKVANDYGWNLEHVDDHGNIMVPLDQTKGYRTYWKGNIDEEE